MKSRILLLSLAFILNTSCSKQNDFYSEAPSDLSDEAKPLYLAHKYLIERNEEGLLAMLSRNSKQSYENERKLDPDYFNEFRKNEYDIRKYRYFSFEEWKEFDDDVDEHLLEMEANLEPAQAIVISYHEDENSSGHGPAVVVKENGSWKVQWKFKPL